jgi:hypothetical protein
MSFDKTKEKIRRILEKERFEKLLSGINGDLMLNDVKVSYGISSVS